MSGVPAYTLSRNKKFPVTTAAIQPLANAVVYQLQAQSRQQVRHEIVRKLMPSR